MPAIQQYALLAVVVIPVAVVIGMNVFLVFFGERDTLLLPGTSRYPRVAFESEPVRQAAFEEQAAVVEYEEEPLRKAA